MSPLVVSAWVLSRRRWGWAVCHHFSFRLPFFVSLARGRDRMLSHDCCSPPFCLPLSRNQRSQRRIHRLIRLRLWVDGRCSKLEGSVNPNLWRYIEECRAGSWWVHQWMPSYIPFDDLRPRPSLSTTPSAHRTDLLVDAGAPRSRRMAWGWGWGCSVEGPPWVIVCDCGAGVERVSARSPREAIGGDLGTARVYSIYCNAVVREWSEFCGYTAEKSQVRTPEDVSTPLLDEEGSASYRRPFGVDFVPEV